MTTQDLAVVDVVPASQKRVIKVEAGFTEQESLEVSGRNGHLFSFHVRILLLLVKSFAETDLYRKHSMVD